MNKNRDFKIASSDSETIQKYICETPEKQIKKFIYLIEIEGSHRI